MRVKGLAVAALGALALTLALASPASATLPRRGPNAPVPKPVATRILVKFKSTANVANVLRALHDVSLGQTLGRVTVIQVRHGETYQTTLRRYRYRWDVSYAEPDYQIRPSDLGPPSDPFFGQQWALDRIHAVQGWTLYPGSYSATTGGVKIAVVDTGVWASHPDLLGRVDTADGAGCLGNGFICSHSASFADDYGHGTHVSGIAAAATNNATGVAGLAVNSTIIPVKVCDSGGSCSDSSIANGIAWAVAHGARVVNLSLGGYGFSKTMCDAVKAANAAGAVVDAATGNDGIPFPSYPAACPGAIGVGATGNDDDNIAWFSNWDYPGVFVTAPGGNDVDPTTNDPTTQILSTVPFSLISFGPALYQSIEGTSMSTPYVSGLAALLLSQRPGRTPADVARVLAKTSDKVGAEFTDPLLSDTPGPYYGENYGTDGLRGPNPYNACVGCTWHPFWGYGRIDVAAALAGAQPKVLSFSPLSATVGQTLTINGEDLGTVTGVTVAGGSASPISALNEDKLQVTVPADAVQTGSVSVTTPSGTSPLTGFKLAPKIDGFGSPSGIAGVDSLVVNGSGFFNASAVRFGTLNATAGLVVSQDGTQVTIPIPAIAKSGKITVVTPNGLALSTASFAIVGAPHVTSFSPAAAPVGGLVTISGSSLDSVTGVRFGDGSSQTAITVVSPFSIKVVVPAGAHSGQLSVTNPSSTALSTGLFKLAPKIDGFGSPNAHAGDPLTVLGSGLFNATLVKFGAFSAAPTSVAADGTSITVTIPPTAKSGKVSVVTPNGTATSAGSLAILGPPTVTSFSPVAAPVGGTVTINGGNLDSATDVQFGTSGGHQTAITVVSPGSIKVVVPAGAQNGPLTVTNPNSGVQSAVNFKIAPKIDSITPAAAPPFSTFAVNGSGLQGGVVKIGIVVAPASGSYGQLTVTVPSSAPSGKVTVTTPNGSTLSTASFTGIKAPAIPSFAPSTGSAGSLVTISGANMSFATAVTWVASGAVQSDITVLSPTSIRVAVPDGARTGPISVTNPAGTTQSLVSFTVPFVLDSFDPGVAAAGGGVILNGTSLLNASGVEFNGTPALFSWLSDEQLIALVPPTATDGPVTVTDFLGESSISEGDFHVIHATTRSPGIGPVGSLVTITGVHLDAVQEVDFNGTPADDFEVQDAGTTLLVNVPAGATDGPIQLLDDVGGAAETDPFQVISVDDFFPATGSPGAAVGLLGSHFEGATAVKFGTVATTAFSVHSSGKVLAVTVPPGAETGHISVVTPNGTAVSADTFTVLP